MQKGREKGEENNRRGREIAKEKRERNEPKRGEKVIERRVT